MSDKKAYFIRSVNKIENHSEFFELVYQTKSNVVCTADGLVINNNIEISPLAYNEIGKQIFKDRLNSIKIANDNLANKIGHNF
jgi:hypothetical protein